MNKTNSIIYVQGDMNNNDKRKTIKASSFIKQILEHNINEPLFEVLPPKNINQLIRYYFDYDYSSDELQTKEQEELHLLKAQECLDKVFAGTTFKMVVASYNGRDGGGENESNKKYGKFKISYHFHIYNFVNTLQKNKELAIYIKNSNINDFAKNFDTTVYQPNRLFRFATSHKYSDRDDDCRQPKAFDTNLIRYLVTHIPKEYEKNIWKYIPLHPESYPYPPNVACVVKKRKLNNEVDNKMEIKVDDINTDNINILESLPSLYLDNYTEWIELALTWKSAYPNEKSIFMNWSIKSKRYSNCYKENSIIYDNLKPKITQKVAQTKIFALNNDTQKYIKEIREIFRNPNDEAKVAQVVKMFHRRFKVIDADRKDSIYYFNKDTKLWVVINKDYLGCFLTRYFSPYLNILEGDILKEVKDLEKGVLIEASDKKREEMKENIKQLKTMLKAINNHKNTKSKNYLIKEFFNQDQLKDVDFINKLNHDKSLLSTKGGLVNLRDGSFRLREYDDYISYELSVEYNPQAGENELFNKTMLGMFDNPTYKSEMNEIFKLIQIYVGYCVTGYTSEQILFTCIGKGSNGKGVFMNILMEILKSNIPIFDSWNSNFLGIQKNVNSNGATGEEAKMFGKRVGFINEAPEGLCFGENFKKVIDKGQSFTARKQHGQPFTFDLETTFILLSNVFPKFDIEDCFVRRMKYIIEFKNNYCEDAPKGHSYKREKDKNIVDKIVDSDIKKQQILLWIIQGSVEWFNKGLPRLPPKCEFNKQSYINSNDWTRHLEFTEDDNDFLNQADIFENIKIETGMMIEPTKIKKILEDKGAVSARMRIGGRRLTCYKRVKFMVDKDLLDPSIETDNSIQSQKLQKGQGCEIDSDDD